MLELQSVRPGILGCYASTAALERVAMHGELTIRVAPGELLLVGHRVGLAELTAELAGLDPSSLVIDLSSSFSIWALRGHARLEAFCRLSAVPLPDAPAVAQGLVARVPARTVVAADELLVITSSAVSHHLRDRVFAACADLAPVEAPARTLVHTTEHATLA
jgi:hypothetical protein